MYNAPLQGTCNPFKGALHWLIILIMMLDGECSESLDQVTSIGI